MKKQEQLYMMHENSLFFGSQYMPKAIKMNIKNLATEWNTCIVMWNRYSLSKMSLSKPARGLITWNLNSSQDLLKINCLLNARKYNFLHIILRLLCTVIYKWKQNQHWHMTGITSLIRKKKKTCMGSLFHLHSKYQYFSNSEVF